MYSWLSSLGVLGVAALFARDIWVSVLLDRPAFLKVGDFLPVHGALSRIWVFVIAAGVLALLMALWKPKSAPNIRDGATRPETETAS